jgi:hypothetical protein
VISRAAAAPAVDAAAAAGLVRAWGEARDWCGRDPYDALRSPFGDVLSLRTRLGRRLLTQAVKRSPLDLRPVLRIAPGLNHKAIGLVVSAYAALASLGDDTARASGERWLGWLEAEQETGVAGGFGYHFDVQTRFFSYPAGSPNTIATSFVAQGLLDGAELLAADHALAAARRAAGFLVDEMLVAGSRGPYFRYVPQDDKLIHNANLLACAVLLRLAEASGDDSFCEIAAPAVQTSLAAQRPDGSWPYSDWGGNEWVDNFHTGYVLESLAAVRAVDGVQDALERGVEFWATRLFLDTGEPKYYPDSVYPLDAHCYAQAIDTWLSVPVEDGVERAERVAALLVRDMIRPDGSVVFQRGRLITNRARFVRWTSAPSFRALARLARAQERVA